MWVEGKALLMRASAEGDGGVLRAIRRTGRMYNVTKT